MEILKEEENITSLNIKEAITDKPKLNININLTCQKHNSKIGGICGDINCEEISLLCIKCATDKDSCIRKLKHPLVDIEEYFETFNNDFSSKLVQWKELLFNPSICDLGDRILEHKEQIKKTLIPTF